MNLNLTPDVLAGLDQDIARMDAQIDAVLGALRIASEEVDAEPGLAVAMVMATMQHLSVFHLKALAARLLVRLSQTEERR